MAAAIAGKTGNTAAEAFLSRYMEAHFDRMLTPAFTVAARGWRNSVKWDEVPEVLRILRKVRHYTHVTGLTDDRATQEAQVREGFTRLFGTLGFSPDDPVFQPPIDEFVAKVVDAMNASGGEASEAGP